MTPFTPLRDLPQEAEFSKNDVFVLFGELFTRGYANGLVEEAKAAGMTIVGITVGRREKDNSLRPLTPEELVEAEANLGGKVINVPLWAGFDMDAPEGKKSPADILAKVKTKEWEDFKIDWDLIEQAKEVGVRRFKQSVAEAMEQIKALIPQGANVLFAHTMAGGIPKAKVLLLLNNHAVKGKGKRYLSSGKLWESDLGQLQQKNSIEVTAKTLQYLLDGTEEIRNLVASWNGEVRYAAYGYHGTEILINGQYQWQTYNPYVPGWGKLELENIANRAWEKGIKVTVFNCPEVRTNSSDIFSGVELSLYPLIHSFLQEGGSTWAQEQKEACNAKLEEGYSLDSLLENIDQYHQSDTMQDFYNDFEHWPRHNSPESAELMLTTSDEAMKQNQSKKDTITHHLSELVVQGAGSLMFRAVWNSSQPVLWLGHAIIAKEMNRKHSA
ncbi:MAG: hypothetical protein COB67_01235 [SAR324 cluster bacterium]|uniref:Uncharacterized protein n=1 Tax=SAR324 cluster bacterium TaxID=2024889 RepID=A0A2A4TAM9_9DELT|nr:MAG: hypothetical protein COB67_01235 [SAR324 cluster bacterium]